MARTILLQQTAQTRGGAAWTLTGEERSGADHPVYAPFLPTPSPGIFLSLTDPDGNEKSYERVADANVLAQRAASVIAIIEAMD